MTDDGVGFPPSREWRSIFFRRWGSGQDSCFRGNDVEVVPCGDEVSDRSGWCFFAGMTDDGVGFPPSREWRMMGLDSRLRGNGGVFFSGVGVVGRIPVFAGMTLR